MLATVGSSRGSRRSGDRDERMPPRRRRRWPRPRLPAASHRERRGPNAAIYGGRSTASVKASLPPLAEVPLQSEEQRRGAREAERSPRLTARPRRSRMRSRDGARSSASHATREGAIVAGKRAPAMSHERHDSCTQCHVAAGGPPGPALARLRPAPSSASPRRAGSRLAWRTANHPPYDDDAKRVRQLSRSGGRHGYASTHPWRESCTQCHAPSAKLDQRGSIFLSSVHLPRRHATHERRSPHRSTDAVRRVPTKHRDAS